MLLLIGLATIVGVMGQNPHQPYKWTLARGADTRVLQTQVTAESPSFNVSVPTLLGIDNWGKAPPPNYAYYFCPSSNPGKEYCNDISWYYCPYWDCVTIPGWDYPSSYGSDEYLEVEMGPKGCKPGGMKFGGTMLWGNCTHLLIHVTQPEDPGWRLGRTWGIGIWEPGKHRNGLIQIQKEEVVLQKQDD